MLRECAEALAALTVDTPLVLVLEDSHWSDLSTIECLTAVAQRRKAARLLVLGTYRLVETVLRTHPLRGMVQELCGGDRAWSSAWSSSLPRRWQRMWRGGGAGQSPPPWSRLSIPAQSAMRCSW